MSGRLQGRVAIVTGAGCVGPGWGNGPAVAVRFAEEGAKVFAVDRDLQAAEETSARVKAVGGDIALQQCDVTDRSSVKKMVEACLRLIGPSGLAWEGNATSSAPYPDPSRSRILRSRRCGSLHALDAVKVNCIDNVAGRGIDCDLAGDATSFGLCAEKEAVITRILLCVLSNLAVRMCNRSHPGVLGTQRKVQILANALGAA